MFSMGSGSFMQYAKITCKLWNVDIWGMPKKLIAYSILVHFLMNEGGLPFFSRVGVYRTHTRWWEYFFFT